jgi:hypothetical protein
MISVKEIAIMSIKIVAVVGLRVHVSDCNQNPLGFGTITKVEPITDGDTDKILMDDYPSEITLDNGTKTQGAECYWIAISELSPEIITILEKHHGEVAIPK